jgi:UDP-glucose 4-epimerase
VSFQSYFLVGGAGFIGSHFVDALLKDQAIRKVTVFDNFSSGQRWHLADHDSDVRFSVLQGDVSDLTLLAEAMRGHAAVMHFASNPDIALAATCPGIDFSAGIFLTWQVVEAARLSGVQRIVYISGSGVYGETGTLECKEDQGNLIPISTYGASKLGGEAFLASYCHMFGLTARVFRLGNVVGPRQTHGVGYDFVRRLLHAPKKLRILGDGSQSKSYIHVHDVVAAILLANQHNQSEKYAVYNVATGDYITVREIADIVVNCVTPEQSIQYEFTGGDRGWKGDVPVVRLNTDKIRALGWVCKRNSAQAIRDSVIALTAQVKEGLIPLTVADES